MFEKIKSDFRVCYYGTHFVWQDWPSLLSIIMYRYGSWCDKRPKLIRRILLLFYVPFHAFGAVFTGIQIPRKAMIGQGFRIHHYGTVIIHGRAQIGDFCELRPGVVIGALHTGNDVPVIGNHVSVGVGAKILGTIKIGDYAKIGANAVVIQDVPAHFTAVGVPARLIPPKNVI